MKNQPLSFTFSRQRRIWSFHAVVMLRTVKKCTKNYNARARLLFCSLNLLFRYVPVGVGVVVFFLFTGLCGLGSHYWRVFCIIPWLTTVKFAIRLAKKALKALVNDDTLLLVMFLGLRKLGNICCGHKMFLNKIRNTFCVADSKFVSATNVARAGKRGNICVSNNSRGYTCLLPKVTQWVIALGWDRFGFPARFSSPVTL